MAMNCNFSNSTRKNNRCKKPVIFFAEFRLLGYNSLPSVYNLSVNANKGFLPFNRLNSKNRLPILQVMHYRLLWLVERNHIFKKGEIFMQEGNLNGRECTLLALHLYTGGICYE